MRRALNWFALVAVALAGLAVTGKAAPSEGEGTRIVLGYASSGRLAARELERQLGADRIAAIPELEVDLVEVTPERAAAVLTILRSSPVVRYAEPDRLVRALGAPNDEL